jgi:drug/metabolite transporter (DMT)-like permease
MSAEGVTLIARATLVISLIIAAAIFRTLVGPGKRRGRIMLAGTLGGISFGVLIAYPISQWLKMDVSAVCACLGMTIGWTVSWLFARQTPREALTTARHK